MPNFIIHIVQGRNLKAMDMGFGQSKKSDPYVLISVAGAEQTKTKRIDNDLNPTWNALFSVSTSEQDDTMTLEVMDHDRITKDDLIGRKRFSLRQFLGRYDQPEWYPIVDNKDKHTGDILVGIYDHDLYQQRNQQQQAQQQPPPPPPAAPTQPQQYSAPPPPPPPGRSAGSSGTRVIVLEGKSLPVDDAYLTVGAHGRRRETSDIVPCKNPTVFDYQSTFPPGTDEVEIIVYDAATDNPVAKTVIPLAQYEGRPPQRKLIYHLKDPHHQAAGALLVQIEDSGAPSTHRPRPIQYDDSSDSSSDEEDRRVYRGHSAPARGPPAGVPHEGTRCYYRYQTREGGWQTSDAPPRPLPPREVHGGSHYRGGTRTYSASYRDPALALDAADGVIDGAYRGAPITRTYRDPALSLDAADGRIDGTYRGAPITRTYRGSSALALDAADGRIDGTYHGAPITSTYRRGPQTTYASSALALDAADGRIDGTYHGARIHTPAISSYNSSAYALDAADGRIDGTYHGAPVRSYSAPRTRTYSQGSMYGGTVSYSDGRATTPMPYRSGASYGPEYSATTYSGTAAPSGWSPKWGSGYSTSYGSSALAWDAADGRIDGTYFGAPTMPGGAASPALALDAADGRIDGTYHGAPVQYGGSTYASAGGYYGGPNTYSNGSGWAGAPGAGYAPPPTYTGGAPPYAPGTPSREPYPAAAPANGYGSPAAAPPPQQAPPTPASNGTADAGRSTPVTAHY